MRFVPKAIVFLILCGVGIFFLDREERRGAFASANRTYVDWLIGNSKQKIREPSVTLLRIDEASMDAFETAATFGPLEFAQLLNRLHEYAPKVVAIEPVLAWEQTEELLLNALEDTALKFDRLLLGSVLEVNPAAPPIPDAQLSLFPRIGRVTGDLARVPEFTAARDLPELPLRITARLGFTRIDLGEAGTGNGSALGVPLLARHGDTVVPSFVLHAVMLENDVAANEIEVLLGKEIRLGNTLAIPIDARGYLAVYAGLRERLPSHGAEILIWNPDEVVAGDGTGQGMSPEERRALESRVVLVGYDDADARRIPLRNETRISRAELFALAIATVQSGKYIRRLPGSAEIGVWAALVLAGLGILRCRKGRAVGLSLLLLVLYLVAGMLVFQSRQAWLPAVIPLSLIGCALLAAVVLPGAPADAESLRSRDPGL